MNDEEPKTDWKPDYTLAPRRLVCAAVKKGERIVTGPRHYDKTMRQQMRASEGLDFWTVGVEQGFVDQFGDFVNRTEAWVIATEQDQIRRNVSCEGTLYSENLY